MKKYATFVPLLLLPVLVLVLVAHMATTTGSAVDVDKKLQPVAIQAQPASGPVTLEVQNTMTMSSKYEVTNLSDTDSANVSHEFYEEGGTLRDAFSASIAPETTKRYDLATLTNAGIVDLNDFVGTVVVSSTTSFTASLVPPPPPSYLPVVRLDPTPTPTPTPVAPTPLGIYKRISQAYQKGDWTIFWGYFWNHEGPGHPASGSIYAEFCFDTGDRAGECKLTSHGHDGNTGLLHDVLAQEPIEAKGTVELWRAAADGVTLVEPVSRKFIFDTRELGTVFGIEFQECTTADTTWECDPDQWSAATNRERIEGVDAETLTEEEFDAYLEERSR